MAAHLLERPVHLCVEQLQPGLRQEQGLEGRDAAKHAPRGGSVRVNQRRPHGVHGVHGDGRQGTNADRADDEGNEKARRVEERVRVRSRDVGVGGFQLEVHLSGRDGALQRANVAEATLVCKGLTKECTHHDKHGPEAAAAMCDRTVTTARRYRGNTEVHSHTTVGTAREHAEARTSSTERSCPSNSVMGGSTFLSMPLTAV